MANLICHQYAPASKRQAYADAMSSVDGQPSSMENISIELTVVPGGPSDLWNTFKGYTGKWWGASQGYPPAFAQALMTAATAAGTEAWFVAVTEGGDVVAENLTASNIPMPSPVTFATVAAAVGLSISTS